MPVSCGNASRKTAPSESSLDNSLLHLFNNKLTEDDKRRILSLCPDFCKVLVQLNGWFNDSALKRSKNENLGCMIEHVNQHLEPLLNFLRTQKIPMAEEMKKRKVVEVETILKRHRAVDMSDFLFDTLAVKGLNWRRTFSVKDELLSKEKRKPRLEELSSVLLTKIEDISKSLTKHETGLTERMEEAMRLFEIELEFFKKAVEDSRVLKKTESMMQTPKVESVPLKRVECHSVTNNQLEPTKNIKRRREVKRILWKRLDTGRLMQMKIRANELRNEIENALKQLSFLKPMYNGCLKLAETRKQCVRRTRNANRKLRLLNEKEKKFKTEIEAYSKAVEKANIRSERKSSAIAALESKLGAEMNKLREWSKATKMYEEQIEMMKVNKDRTFYEALTFERRFNEITRVNETEVENHEEIESALQWTQRYIRRGSLDIAKISSQIENVKRKYTATSQRIQHFEDQIQAMKDEERRFTLTELLDLQRLELSLDLKRRHLLKAKRKVPRIVRMIRIKRSQARKFWIARLRKANARMRAHAAFSAISTINPTANYFKRAKKQISGLKFDCEQMNKKKLFLEEQILEFETKSAELEVKLSKLRSDLTKKRTFAARIKQLNVLYKLLKTDVRKVRRLVDTINRNYEVKAFEYTNERRCAHISVLQQLQKDYIKQLNENAQLQRERNLMFEQSKTLKTQYERLVNECVSLTEQNRIKENQNKLNLILESIRRRKIKKPLESILT
ncbi:hypothetical protein ACOME3_007667 [Neoechinorhynchus agilis]